MECEFCGEKNIAEGALACPICGSPVKRSEAEQPTAPEQPTAGAPPGAVQQAPTGSAPPQQAPPGAPPPPMTPPAAPAAPPPLAAQEQDFIALAEESVTLDNGGAAQEAAPGQAPTDASSLADQQVAPGAVISPERVTLDDTLTSGYKGPEGPSVGGAGEQTADDPFGLNISENAPPVMPGPIRMRSRYSLKTPANIIKFVLIMLLVLAAIFVGVYFGIMKKGNEPDTSQPTGVVEEYFINAVKGESGKAAALGVQGSVFIKRVNDAIRPYTALKNVYADIDYELGEAKLDKSGNYATIPLKKLQVKYKTAEGKEEVADILTVLEPAPVPRTVTLVKQNDKWLIQ